MYQRNKKIFLPKFLAISVLSFIPLFVQADSAKSCIEMSATNKLSDSKIKVIQSSDSLAMTFAWNQVDPDAYFDIYIALQLPSTTEDMQLRFLDKAGNFHQTVVPNQTNQQARNGKTTVLKYEKLPFANVRLDQLTGMGQYAFHAVIVPTGTETENVQNPAYWVGDLCSEMIFVTRTR